MRALSAFAVASVVALPRVALACPSCARDGNPTAVVLMVAAFLAVPLALGGVVFAVARWSQQGEGP